MDNRTKKVVWFNTALKQSGGGERLGIESVRGLRKQGIEAYYVVFNYDKNAVFDGRYHDNSFIWKGNGKPPVGKDALKVLPANILWLRRKLKEISPDIVITQGTWGQVVFVFFATLLTGIPYSVHIFGSLFAFPPSYDLTKYSFIFRKHFHEIRNSLESYQRMVPERMPPVATVKRLKNEFYSFVKYLAVRRARRIFVLSSRNGWEVKKLFRRKAVVLKGAFPLSIFDYVQKIDVKKQIGIEGKRMVLSICRLAVNKRVDLCIRAFAHLSRRVENVVLVIGGSGPEEEYLRSVVKELNLEPKVRFVGYVPDGELWDYVIASDLFVSLDLADFDIAPFEALALGRKVIWASEMEMDEALLAVRLLFPAEPTVVDVSLRMEGALNTVVTDDQIKKYRSILSKYSWEDYARKMLIQ